MWGGTFPFSFLRWGCLLLSNPDPGFGDQECLNKPKQCIAPFYRVHSRMVRAGFYLGLESFLRLQPGTAVDNKHLWCHPYINIPTSCCVPCLNTWDLPKNYNLPRILGITFHQRGATGPWHLANERSLRSC